MKDSKSYVLEMILRYALDKIQKESITVATLGGNGHEAEIWNTMGLNPKQGWLIERSRAKQGNLVTTYNYQVCNQLDSFAQVIGGVTSSGVDCFHLDLCGTFSGQYQKVLPSIIDLVSKSKGRICAITVADQRGNMITQNWEETGEKIKEDLGAEYSNLSFMITETHKNIPTPHSGGMIKPFDLEKSVKREIGLYWTLFSIFKTCCWEVTPLLLHRFVYVSRLSGHPFRMRTYVFYIGDEPMSHGLFMREWTSSAMTYVNGDSIVGVPVCRTRKDQQMGQTQLKTLVYASGNQTIINEFHKLVKDQEKLRVVVAALGDTVSSINREPQPLVVNTSPDLPDTSPAETVNTKKQEKKAKKVYTDLSEKEKVQFLLYLIRERTSGTYSKKMWETMRWPQLLKTKFGYYDAKLGRSVRSALARVSGKFRVGFVDKVHKTLEPSELRDIKL